MIWLCTGIHLGLFFWVIGHGLRVMNNLFIFFKSKIFGFRVTFVMSDSCESRLSVDYASSALGSLFFTSFMQPVISNCTKKCNSRITKFGRTINRKRTTCHLSQLSRGVDDLKSKLEENQGQILVTLRLFLPAKWNL